MIAYGLRRNNERGVDRRGSKEAIRLEDWRRMVRKRQSLESLSVVTFVRASVKNPFDSRGVLGE